MARILIIEDEAQIRILLKKILVREGHEIVEAADGDAGMEQFRNEPADLIITDIIMPGKEGIETIMELRREFPEVKVIAVSGGGRIGPEGYLDLARKVGARYTFAKPFDRRELLAAVRDLLPA